MNNKVIIFSAPSGSGKTTLVKHCLEQIPNLSFSVSATTRAPRGNEKNGQDYYFLTPDEFRIRIASDDFVEYEEVYPDKFYGTLKSEVQRIWDSGGVVIFDVDVVGGVNLKKYFQDEALSVFIAPPSVEELEKRLKGRATDDEDTIKVRVQKAEEELKYQKYFDKVVVNDQLTDAQKEIKTLIIKFLEQ
ncbi:guanylate kinase [Riemerella columbipharyngis]|uniref:Guanylate kinase n=1 Tax=Riemerella columbipharyngis TaxID=1071918 RepID=A0A1G7BSC5_9FLAO|nr:guanylate kinase [Riemerella columbipharyngis]SDE29550.1 guanylate kinase [Riemerella columbipharyngis]